jgi:L-alanine-DL-glutamate epimerase-like enolase superfamily enzyme
VHVEGRGLKGSGECLAWTVAEQTRFVARSRELLTPGEYSLAELSNRLRHATADAYERAALELAGVDLALRQNETNIFHLAGSSPQPVTFVFSYAALPDPAWEIRVLRRARPGARVKLDVDPGWADAVFVGLAGAEEGSVAVLDFKLRGDRRLIERAHSAVPTAIIEDPNMDALQAIPPDLAARIAFDGPVTSADKIESLPFRPAAVNVKLGRLGGLFETLRAIDTCCKSAIGVYVGGQFEVGPGRRQAQVLASLFSPEAENDVAPLLDPRPDSAPGRLMADEPASRPDPPASPLQIPSDFQGLTW